MSLLLYPGWRCFIIIQYIDEAKAASKRREGESTKKEQETRHGLERVTVGRVIDGDTFETSDGRRVRLVGVNTPESTIRTEAYGKEASSYTTSKLEGKQVWMQKMYLTETVIQDTYPRIVWLEVPSNDMDENEIQTKMFNAYLCFERVCRTFHLHT